MNIQKVRNDGRFPEELRKLQYFFKKVENRGFVYWRQGNTIVNTSISQSRERAQLTINLSFLESSRNEPMNERRIYEMRKRLHDVFSDVFHPETYIEINVDVVCDDGSLFSVITNSISIACMYNGISMTDVCISVTVNTNADLNYQEENRPFSVCLVLAPNIEKVLYLQAFGRMQHQEFEEALRIGMNTCKIYHERFKEIMCGTKPGKLDYQF